MILNVLPFCKQPDQMDCGPTCIRMVAKHYGRNYSLERLREISGINRSGVSLLGISEAAEKIGFRTTGVKINVDKLMEMDMPCIDLPQKISNSSFQLFSTVPSI